MTLSLRQLARSRRLRAMGVLAWLLLVVNSLAAAPMGMNGIPPSHVKQTTVATASVVWQHTMTATRSPSCCDDEAGCCDGMAGQACHCAAECGTTLPSATVVVMAAAAITASYVMPLPSSAPSLNTAPPLRPPLV